MAKEVEAWDESQVRAFQAAVADHRWGGPLRIAVLYGLRRSELLALRWGGIDLEAGTVTASTQLRSTCHREPRRWTIHPER